MRSRASGWPWRVLLATLVIGLDMTVLAVALPTLARVPGCDSVGSAVVQRCVQL